MKNGWIKTHLSDVAAVQSGAGFPERYQGQAEREIPFYKVSDMNIAGNEREMISENNSITEKVRRELGAFLFPRGSTIFPKIGGAIATNKKRLTTRDCCVDNNVMGVIPKPGKIESDFLFYFFLGHDLSEFANEAHLPSIKKTVVEGWPIVLPAALTEQQRIVGILDEAFAGLATAKANAEKNLQNAHALFESYVESVFIQRGKGWVEKTLGEIGKVCMCKRIFKEETIDTAGIPFYKIGTFGKEPDAFIPNQTYQEYRAKYPFPKKGDVLISASGTIGRRVRYDGEPAYFQDSNIVWIDNEEEQVVNDYLYHFYGACAWNSTKGATISRLYNDNLRRIVIAFPESLQEQRRIVAQLDALSEETQRLAMLYKRKLAALEALKKSLLHQAFSGEL